MQASISQLITFEYKNASLAILWDKLRLRAMSFKHKPQSTILALSVTKLRLEAQGSQLTAKNHHHE